MHSSLATSTNTALLLANSPAQTCIALGANYNYGRQGLPELPTRLNPNKKRRPKSRKLSACPASATSTSTGPDSSKRKTTTTANASAALSKKDLFPSSYRPYDDKSLLTNTLSNSTAALTKEHHRIPATLSRSSNDSTTSSNSTSSTVINDRRGKRKDSKKVIVIKKKSRKHQKVNHLHLPKESKQSVMEKSSTHSAKDQSESLSHLYNNKCKGVEEKTKRKDDHAGADEFHTDSFQILSPSAPSSAKDEADEDEDFDDYGENTINRGDGDTMDINNCMMSMRSRPIAEKVRCTALPLLKQRLGYLWEKKMFTDVVFLVGRNRQKIEAHRVILASCSEVFQSLLYGEGKPLQNSDEKYILYENDFSEQALEVFIKAMYTNEIPICLTLAMALEVFYATKKYAVIFLEDQVLEHIRQLLTVSNVFEALRFSTNAVELTYLAPICWRIVEERTAEVLEYHLDNLETHLFIRILERDRLSIDEVQLFQYAVRWATNLCKINGMKVTGKNKRHFMEPLLKHFRFTTMNPVQFTEMVAPSRILESREILQIQSAFNKVADLKNIALPYKPIPRINTANQMLKDQNVLHSPQTAESSRRGSSTNIQNSKCTNKNGCNMDGSGDGQQQVQTICSDSMVFAPGLGSKVHFNGNKKGTSSKLKNRRVPSSHSSKAR